jgi:hypothetical protein
MELEMNNFLQPSTMSADARSYVMMVPGLVSSYTYASLAASAMIATLINS